MFLGRLIFLHGCFKPFAGKDIRHGGPAGIRIRNRDLRQIPHHFFQSDGPILSMPYPPSKENSERRYGSALAGILPAEFAQALNCVSANGAGIQTFDRQRAVAHEKRIAVKLVEIFQNFQENNVLRH